MTNRTKTRINADGEVVRASDDELTSSSTVLRSGNTLDVFGFNLEWRQLLIVLGVLSLMIGLQGTFAFLAVLGLYTLWNRLASHRRTSISNSSTSASASGSGGGSSGSSWGGGPRIRGVKDLPCDPKGG